MITISGALANKTWTAGQKPFGPTQVPVGVWFVRTTIDMADFLDPLTTCRIYAELSLNGENGDYFTLRDTTFTGSAVEIIHPDTGLVLTESYAGTELPQPDNVNRWIRGFMELSERTKIGMNIYLFEAGDSR